MSALTVAEICQRLDVTPRTLMRWKASGCPVQKDGNRILFDIDAVQAWRDAGNEPMPAKRGRPKKDPSEPGKETIAEVQLRKERALAERHELFIAEKRGELVPREAVRAQVSAAFYQLRQRLNNIRPTIEARHGTAVAVDVEAEIDRAVEVLVTEWTVAA